MSSKKRISKKLRLAPISDEISFRDLQKKHGHLIKHKHIPQQNYVTLQYIKRRPRFKGYLQNSELLEEHDAGSHANILLYPEKEQPDDDVPEYIFSIQPRKHRVYDSLSNLMQNGVRKKTYALTQQELLRTERNLVDNMVADYLCNNNYGHVIPVYEGTGISTCACCTNRNRENVRNSLGLPPDPSNTVQPMKNKSSTDQRMNIKVNPLGTKLKQKVRGLTMDPSFRLSDTEARMNWASSATFEDPDFYKKATRSYPTYNQNINDTHALYHNFPKTGSTFGFVPEAYRKLNSRILPVPYSLTKKESDPFVGSVKDSLPYNDFNPLNVNKRIDSADKKYQYAMSNLRKFTTKQ